MEILCFCRHDNHDGDILGNFISPKKSPHKSKPAYTVLGDSLPLVSAWEKVEQLHSSEPGTDVKKAAERTRPKSGLIVRGMMAGPVASSPQVGLPPFLFPVDQGVGDGLQALLAEKGMHVGSSSFLVESQQASLIPCPQFTCLS